jgi:hypothetical protein
MDRATEIRTNIEIYQERVDKINTVLNSNNDHEEGGFLALSESQSLSEERYYLTLLMEELDEELATLSI